MRKWIGFAVVLVLLSFVVAACAPPTPVVQKETVVVEKTVKETVVVEKTVVVEQQVEVEKVVTATPAPAPTRAKEAKIDPACGHGR